MFETVCFISFKFEYSKLFGNTTISIVPNNILNNVINIEYFHLGKLKYF